MFISCKMTGHKENQKNYTPSNSPKIFTFRGAFDRFFQVRLSAMPTNGMPARMQKMEP